MDGIDGTTIALACCCSFIPALFLGTLIYQLDHYEREPWQLLVVTFFWGAVVAVIFSLITQLIAAQIIASELVQAVAIAPFTEELSKGAALILLALIFRREFDSITDGIVYGAIVGFGFAVTENVLYLLSAASEGGIAALFVLAVLRTVIFGLNHSFFTSLTGIGVAVARLSKGGPLRFLAPLLGMGAAMLMHGLHNLGASLTEASLLFLGFSFLSDWMGIVGVAGLLFFSLNRERHWMTTYLPEEIELGVISQVQYQSALSATRRAQLISGRLFSGRLAQWRAHQRFYSLCAELAQKKHQCVTYGDKYQGEVGRIRNELTKLAPTVGDA